MEQIQKFAAGSLKYEMQTAYLESYFHADIEKDIAGYFPAQ